jgi:single-stranded-DNA-specific exonuclease
MKESATRVADALENQENIVVYSDYDMDGMSGLAVLKGFLSAVSRNSVGHYQPHRFEEGYGVHSPAIENIKKTGAHVVITVDTGITAFEAAQTAKMLGLVLIITDHHKQVDNRLPETPFIVNPNQNLDTSGLRHISGAGMAFYFCMALRSILRERNYFTRYSIAEPSLTRWLDFFVLGTIADVVELKGDNRILVKSGLEKLNSCEHAGLRALIDHLKATQKYFADPKITSRDVAFTIAPKLNAASRMGRADLATELLLCNDSQVAPRLVLEIMSLNQQRTEVQELIFKEALVQAEAQIRANNPGILITKGNWHEGVLGIVAAKLSEKFNRASIVLAESPEHDFLRGSMRSPLPLSCVKILEQTSSVLDKFGGHQAAAGLTLKQTRFDSFCELAWDLSGEFLKNNPFKKTLHFDGFINPYNDFVTIEEIGKFEKWGGPFGQGNSEPLFLVKDVPTQVVTILKEKHIKCQFSDKVSAIGFGFAETIDALKSQKITSFDALVTPELNRFRDRITVQLKIKHVGSTQTIDIVS